MHFAGWADSPICEPMEWAEAERRAYATADVGKKSSMFTEKYSRLWWFMHGFCAQNCQLSCWHAMRLGGIHQVCGLEWKPEDFRLLSPTIAYFTYLWCTFQGFEALCLLLYQWKSTFNGGLYGGHERKRKRRRRRRRTSSNQLTDSVVLVTWSPCKPILLFYNLYRTWAVV